MLENKLRLFLTVLSICVAVASVLLISSVSGFGTRAVRSELDSLGMNGLIVSSGSSVIRDSDIECIGQISGIERAAPVTLDASQVFTEDGGTNAMIWGIDENAEDVVSLDLVYGRCINKGDIKANSRVCMVDQSLAVELFGREDIVGRSIDLLCGQTVRSFSVVGVVKTGKGIMQSLMGSYFPAFLYAPYTAFRSDPDFTQVFVKTDGETPTDKISLDVEKTLGSGVTVTDLAGRKGVLEDMLATVTTILTVIGAISVFVSGISIMNIMLISVSERTREIGIKKSIGASGTDILLDFLLESVIIAFAGTLFGTALACLAVFCADMLFGLDITVPIVSVVRAMLTAVTLGMIFGIFPAYKASRFRPVEALRR